MQGIIRLAVAADAAAVQAIYAPQVKEGWITFEEEVPTVAEMAGRTVRTLERYPWLVCVYGDKVAGYAYASTHRDRAAYRWATDCSVYIQPDYWRRGVGRGLYTSLFALLRLQGFFTVHAGITLPNPASVGLHTAMGFEPVGVYPAVGYKLGTWHTVGWWQLLLTPPASPPSPPVFLADLPRDGAFATALAVGQRQLQSC